MIWGIGNDIVAVPRIEAALARQGERFAQRVLAPLEWPEFERRRAQSKARAVLFVATRFAAKEALSKALGLGMRSPMGWHACSVLNDEFGKPQVTFNEAMQAWMRERGLRAHISLSDETGYAAAFAVVETL
jgi:holo-[acyl-carrier protein] synthase